MLSTAKMAKKSPAMLTSCPIHSRRTPGIASTWRKVWDCVKEFSVLGQARVAFLIRVFQAGGFGVNANGGKLLNAKRRNESMCCYSSPQFLTSSAEESQISS